MKKILFLYSISIILSIVFLNNSSTFSINNYASRTFIDNLITFYVVTALFFSPLLFLLSDIINYKK